MAKREITDDEKCNSVYGGFRATIPHLVIENGGSDYSKDEIEEMYSYINNVNNPISKKREESIADIHIDRVFKRKCMRGVEEFLKIEYQINTFTPPSEIPCKKIKEDGNVGVDDKMNNNNNNNNNVTINKDGNCTPKNSGIICSDK